MTHSLLFHFNKLTGKYCTFSRVLLASFLLDQCTSYHGKALVCSCIRQWMTWLLRLFCTGHISTLLQLFMRNGICVAVHSRVCCYLGIDKIFGLNHKKSTTSDIGLTWAPAGQLALWLDRQLFSGQMSKNSSWDENKLLCQCAAGNMWSFIYPALHLQYITLQDWQTDYKKLM